jgi:hypothetical protein
VPVVDLQRQPDETEDLLPFRRISGNDRLSTFSTESARSGHSAALPIVSLFLAVKIAHRAENAMLTDFISSQPLPWSWHELYLMLGTSSAALVGLLFVATSLHLAEIANEELYRLRAQYTTLILLSTLLQGTATLVPQPMQVLGVELLAISLWGLSFPLALFSKAVKLPGAHGRGGFSVRRARFFIAAYLVGIVGAGMVAAGKEWGIYAVTVFYTSLLIASIWNGWMIMQGIGRGERLRRK